MQKRPSLFDQINCDIFPPLSNADEDGLLAWSKNLDCRMLLTAYCRGIFPWPVSEREILWFTPPRRAVLVLSELHISSSLRREMDRYPFRLEINRAFGDVIDHCSSMVRKNQEGTWITSKIKKAYLEFHQLGWAYSFEAVTPDDQLAGGLYGVGINSFFAGESMFHLLPGASKFALIKTLEWLRDQARIVWIDIQMLTPLLVRLGAREVSRDEYQQMLLDALAAPASCGVSAALNRKVSLPCF